MRVEAILSKLGLEKYTERDPHSLSGGEQRLLTLGDILVNDPEILILDEPEFGLDPRTFRLVSSILRGLRNEGKTIIMITQNLEATVFLCDRIALMRAGRIMKIARPDEIYCDRELIEEAGLRYMPFFSVLTHLAGEIDVPISEGAFIDALVSVWPREAQL